MHLRAQSCRKTYRCVHRRVPRGVGLALALWLCGGTAYAATADDADVPEEKKARSELEGVSAVTLKRATVFKSPRATSAVDHDELRVRPPRASGDAVSDEDGVFVQRSSYSFATPAIRGQGEGHVLVLVDGIRLNSTLTSTIAGGFGGIEAFKVKPKGAGFEIEDYHDFLKPLMPTDVEIGYDGKVYVSEFGPLKWDGSNNQGRIYTVFDPKKQADADVVGMKLLFAEGFDKLDADTLAKLLEHPDMRVRLRSQFELVKKDPMKFWRILKDSKNQLARLHAIWGIGMASAKKHELGAELVQYLGDKDAEVRCQAAKVLGQRSGIDCNAALVKLLADGGPRAQSFAAEALGRRKAKNALSSLFNSLAENNDADPWLRHALVTALANIGTGEDFLPLTNAKSKAVRLGAVLALRKLGDANVAAAAAICLYQSARAHNV